MQKPILLTYSPKLFTSLFTLALLSGHIPPLQAQSYTAIELAPNQNFTTATSINARYAAGYYSPSASFATSHASLWQSGTQIDLHPALLEANSTSSRSSIEASFTDLQVGWGAGAVTAYKNVPMIWKNTATSAEFLPIPFTSTDGKALSTDGKQIVGYAASLSRDGTTNGPSHALVWDIGNGQSIDLGDGGNGAQAIGVRNGQQVGYIVKSSANAVYWQSSRNSLVSLHPKNAVVSVAVDTDSLQQVGYSSYDIRVRNEAPKGNKDKRFTYATVWSGSATTAINIHPYNFTHSYAVAINRPWIVGYAGDETKLSTPGYYHAIVWNSSFSPIDLQSYLPAKFVGSQAFSVDGSGNIAGVALTANGERHAVIWSFNPN